MLLAVSWISLSAWPMEPWQKLIVQADSLESIGMLSDAMSTAEQALVLLDRSVSASDTERARVYSAMGRYCFGSNLRDAERYYSIALELRERSLGQNHVDVAVSMSNLGRIYVRQSRHMDALPLFRKSYQIQRRLLGPISIGCARTLNSLGNIHRVLCEFHESERCYRDAILAWNRVDESDYRVAMAHNGLGVLYHDVGRYDEARLEYEKALGLYDNPSCTSPSELAIVLDNLARLSHDRGEYLLADQYFEQALQTLEVSSQDDDLEAARILNNYANFWIDQKKYAAAEAALNRALDVQERLLPHDHLLKSVTLNNLSRTLLLQDRLADAEAHAMRAIEISESHGESGHRSLAEALHTLATVQLASGSKVSAFHSARRAFQIRRMEYSKAFDSFIDRVAILNSRALRGEAAFYLSLVLESAVDHAQFASPAAAEIIFNTKAIVTDGMAKRARSIMNAVGISALKAAVDSVAGQISLLERSGSTSSSDEILDLIVERERLEAALAFRQSRTANDLGFTEVTTEEVVASLPLGVALVEFIKYDHFVSVTESQPRYVACVVRQTGDIRLVNLGRAAVIDSIVREFRAYFDDPIKRTAESFYPLGRNLYSRIWEPVRESVEGASLIIVSPDGELNLLSFAALVDETGGYLAESHAIHYIGSARDLVAPPAYWDSGLGLLALGDPKYQDSNKHEDSHDSGNSLFPLITLPLLQNRSFYGKCGVDVGTLPALPGTRHEIDEVCKLWQESLGAETLVTFFDEAANEQNFRHASAVSRVIYLATHGFALPDTCSLSTRSLSTATDEQGFVGENPLTLSGLVLATPRNVDSQTVSSEADGILYADEISRMDLSSTELVVLSACETGLGKVRNGEGVYGLRRAFLTAGARAVISTLWSIDDAATSELMGGLLRSRDANVPEMLRAAQIRAIEKLRSSGSSYMPYTWAAFVVTGAWDWR